MLLSSYYTTPPDPRFLAKLTEVVSTFTAIEEGNTKVQIVDARSPERFSGKALVLCV